MAFRDIVGHRRLLDLLTRSIHRGSLPPSLIFAGPSGVGKRLTAMAVAQVLNCIGPAGPEQGGRASEAAPPFDACGACAACSKIARGVHPDVLLVEPGDSGTIKVDQVRDIVERVAYRPFEGRRRVVVIDEADAMVSAAQNALLKTLEEPPPSSVIILVTSRPDMLLATVRSRCIRLSFAEGARDEVDVEARDVAGRVLAHAAAAGDAARRLDGAKELLANTGAGGAGDRAQLASHLRAMASLLRDVEVLSAGADVRALANRDVPARLVDAYRGERGVRAFAAIDQALVALDRNAGVKVVADWVVLQL